ncbi:MAG: winged helix-turn-helix domain-containing protein [Chloroflexota bacterium]
MNYTRRMRVLVASSDAEFGALLAREVREADVTSVARLTASIRSTQPDVVVLDAGDAQATRVALERARGAAEREALPAVLIVSANSLWLRGALPVELLPCEVLARDEASSKLASAVARMAGVEAPDKRDADGVLWVRDRRALAGPRGTVQLTASETLVFDAVYSAHGVVVSPAQIALALWGQAVADMLNKAAIRSHVYSLRRKLRAAGIADGILVSVAGAGYRFRRGEA